MSWIHVLKLSVLFVMNFYRILTGFKLQKLQVINSFFNTINLATTLLILFYTPSIVKWHQNVPTQASKCSPQRPDIIIIHLVEFQIFHKVNVNYGFLSDKRGLNKNLILTYYGRRYILYLECFITINTWNWEMSSKLCCFYMYICIST